LGVLCNLHKQRKLKIKRKWKSLPNADYFEYMGHTGLLPMAVASWAGLVDPDGDKVLIDNRRWQLLDHNDRGKTFAQIATAIEEQL